MSDSVWVAMSAAGIVLQLVGVWFAFSGLGQLSDDLGFRRGQKVRSLWEAARRWFGKDGRPTKVRVGDIGGGVESSGRVRAQIIRPRPIDTDSLEQWVEYLESRLDTLIERVDWEAEDRAQMATAIHARLDEEERARIAGDRAGNERVTMVAAGKDGSGLRRARRGLVITGVGMVLQATAGFAG